MEDFQGYASTQGQRCSPAGSVPPSSLAALSAATGGLFTLPRQPVSLRPLVASGGQKSRRQHHLESSFLFTKGAGLSFLSHSRPMPGQRFCFRLSSS